MRILQVIPKKVVPRISSGYGAVGPGLAIAQYLHVVGVPTLPLGMRGSCLHGDAWLCLRQGAFPFLFPGMSLHQPSVPQKSDGASVLAGHEGS